ncbi:hypothetical protein [Streptantibioticus ferralitis]|uniref:CBM6 domain-containing protein n=1 Tax=Streptantibioticus ferralitis TaxID=236510 RepID=A0ABT5Z8M8_9ACTN|nr:hypothetical protein [Streptantibioticus ferralitis]MDF2259410.1 hypothetical protein [Streptantibioticus ferralitis]
MTAGGNGTPEPENDDPFAYLYRGEGDEAATQADRRGVPRTSYHQVTRVGERRQAPQQGGYGYPPPQQQAYGQPQTQQQPPQYAPAEPSSHRAGGHGGGSRGTNRRGLMLAAIAVVVVVAIGIGIVALTGSDKKDTASGANSSPAPSTSQSQAPSPSASAKLPEQFAATMTLGGKAAVGSKDPGATGPNGSYVTMSSVGDSATWTVNVSHAGAYSLYLGYGNAGAPATATLAVNGSVQSRPINLDNFTKQSDPAHAWTHTYAYIDLNKGANTVQISCGQGNQCAFDLDKVWLESH